MAKQNSLKQVPFRFNSYHNCWYMQGYTYDGQPDVEWRDNEPFQASLVLIGAERGRSTVRFLWQDPQSDTVYPMFLSGMVDLVTSGEIWLGQTPNYEWIAVKRGKSFGIERYMK